MNNIEFLPNEPDGQHCLQSCYRMVVQALTGVNISLEQAERETNYVDGMPTWQFTALLGFASHGLDVRDIENFDPDQFLLDPVACINRQVGNTEVAKQIVDRETNVEAETSAVRRGIADENVQFLQRVPDVQDLERELSADRMVICNINSLRLKGLEGHRGHVVVVAGMAGSKVNLFNPGPPPDENAQYEIDDFVASWSDPTSNMRNIISVGRANFAG